jgi:Ca2+-binding EF-hand superfamily protein
MAHADGNHGNRTSPLGAQAYGPHANGPSADRSIGHGNMGQMMMMHRGMGGNTGFGPMNRPGQGVMNMMDNDRMQMMMMGHNNMRQPSAEGLGNMLNAALTDYDADGNGALSLDEFQSFHSALIRDIMVDRFQHLDADGDGKISKDEIGNPAQRYQMRSMQDDDTQGRMMQDNETPMSEE